MEVKIIIMKGKSLIVISGICIVFIIIILATVQLKYSVFSESSKDSISPAVITPTGDPQTINVSEPTYNQSEKKFLSPEPSGAVSDEWEKVINFPLVVHQVLLMNIFLLLLLNDRKILSRTCNTFGK